MINFQRGWPDDWADYKHKPLPRLEVYAKGTLRRWALAAAIGGAALGFAAGAALGETISISGSMVTIAPSSVPGELAVVTFENVQVNGGHDDGSYPLAMPGLVVEVIFLWEAGIWGEDRITVLPPDGIVCIPESCAATVMEGFSGHVVLIDWRGM